MSSFRKTLIVMVGLVLLVGTPSAIAQSSSVYGGFDGTQPQTRNIPAGTVVDPGSSLLYIIDTGVNLRNAVGANVSGFTQSLAVVNQGTNLQPNPFGVGGTRSIYNANGTVNAELFNRNFITVTNTHPTQAVTVHFRYFNDECIDVLDFLVLLTCNDTLIFDPFNFQIPGTSFNTRTRIFGPAVGLFAPIRAADFASGRFLIFGTATGTSYEPTNSGVHNDRAELIFPNEFRGGFLDTSSHCNNLRLSDNFGRSSGLRADNLHVFNASAISFNYLIGNWTTAIPFSNVFQAFGINAWTRPAVDLTSSVGQGTSLRDQGDGDGPPLLAANDFRILTGGEVVRAANGTSTITTNLLYLRNDVHGGDTAHVNNINSDGNLDFDSWYGALGLTSLYGAAPEDQSINFLSVVDDYNGSRHSTDTPVGGFIDRSYNLNGAETTYVLQIFDNDENIFDVEEDTPINISPPPFEAPTAVLKIVVDCLRVWITSTRSAATSVDDLQISDLGGIATGLLAHIDAPVDTNDASLGWIRFVRDHSASADGLPDGTNPGTQHGTWVAQNFIHDSAFNASFTTIGYQLVRFSGFGAGWWLSSAASLPEVSITGDPQCNGACPNGGSQ